MKKLLGIVVLGLLLSGNAISGDIDNVQIGSTAKTVCKKIHSCQGNGMMSTQYFPKFKTEIWWITNRPGTYLVFEKVTAPTKFSWTNYKFRNKYYGDTANPKDGGFLKERGRKKNS